MQNLLTQPPAKIFSYFLLGGMLSLCNSNSRAQQPGGVSGTKIWYVTKEAKPNYLVDTSGNNFSAIETNANPKDNLSINFHPSTFFTSREVSTAIQNFNKNGFTCVGIFYPDKNFPSSKSIIAVKSSNGVYTARREQVDTGKTKKYNYGDVSRKTTFQIQSPYSTIDNAMKTGLFYYPFRKPNHSIWSEKAKITLNSSFYGYIPEMAIYNRHLSKDEIRRIQSYLCIKYGTTYDTTYINSEGRITWDINDKILKLYHNRVCAIGRDNFSGLWQPKSNSTYEDNGYSAYIFDSDSARISERGVFIPKTDTSSLYRSLTVEFIDKNPQAIPNNSFLFWGDNGGKIALKPAIDTALRLNAKKYPHLHVISSRSWLMYNQHLIPNPTKLVIAGNFNDKAQHLFNTLYNPFDYQLYRFVLVKLQADTIASLVLNSYFGREQEGDAFKTRTIVWDSVSWLNGKSNYQQFTFGRVPVLNFLEIGKANSTPLTELDYYPYYQQLAIGNLIAFDTLKRPLMYKPGEKNDILFTISPGMAPLKPKFFKIEGEKLIEIKGAISSLVSTGSTVAETFEDDEDSDISSTDTEVPYAGVDSKPGVITPRHKPIEKQTWKIKFRIAADKITPGDTYLILVEDALGQSTTLPFKTQKSTNPAK
jgi:hypothetical protein